MTEPHDTLRALAWLSFRGYVWDAERDLWVRPGDDLGLTLEDAAELSAPPPKPPGEGADTDA